MIHSIAGTPDFVAGGYLLDLADEHRTVLITAFALMITGLGVKAALIPLHSWLPQAMVAPAPVSALLHAVAVVKAGAFGIIRVVYDVYGVELSSMLELTQALLWLASATIIYGSVRALQQQDIKKRLAYSTVSQVSYITLGVALAGPLAVIGGIVHLVHQGLMKVTLFFCAGNFSETLGIHTVQDMNGLGKRMPMTMSAFTIGALGMIGVPPIAGFISKWYLGLGALEVNEDWVLLILMFSSLLNAAYFMPLIYRGWFLPPPLAGWPAERHWDGFWSIKLETHWMLLLPPVLTALLALFTGILAGSFFSPLEWSRLIVNREFGL
jgi:multicomponent Na+:H+ antiporter subunit D